MLAFPSLPQSGSIRAMLRMLSDWVGASRQPNRSGTAAHSDVDVAAATREPDRLQPASGSKTHDRRLVRVP